MMRHNIMMQNLKLLIITLVFSGLVNISSSTQAEDSGTETWYQVEVLVYEPVEQTIAGESWSAVTDNTIPENTIELSPINTQGDKNEPVNAFQKLPPQTLVLTETANKLIASQRYRIITLQGWQQPVKQRNEAEAVHLTDKIMDTADQDTPSRADNGNIILNPPQPNIEPLDEISNLSEETPARINGTITVSLSRYLHMALKLAYYNPDVYLAEQIALQKPDEELIDTFMMIQSRRMRSKEIHVFDHPYFGVIATITPVQREKK